MIYLFIYRADSFPEIIKYVFTSLANCLMIFIWIVAFLFHSISKMIRILKKDSKSSKASRKYFKESIQRLWKILNKSLGVEDTSNNFLETRNLMELTIPLEPLKLSFDTLDTIPWQRLETFGSKVSDIRPYMHIPFPVYTRSKSSTKRYERFFFFFFNPFVSFILCKTNMWWRFTFAFNYNRRNWIFF